MTMKMSRLASAVKLFVQAGDGLEGAMSESEPAVREEGKGVSAKCLMRRSCT